jgi:hypothetical protein
MPRRGKGDGRAAKIVNRGLSAEAAKWAGEAYLNFVGVYYLKR